MDETLAINTVSSFKVPSNLSELTQSLRSSNAGGEEERSLLDGVIMDDDEQPVNAMGRRGRDVEAKLAEIIRAQRRADVSNQRLLCPYQVALAGEGCTLGPACPYRHLSRYMLQRLRQLIPQSHSTTSSAGDVSSEFKLGARVYRWMYRENASSYDGGFCPWRRFGDDWEGALEKGFNHVKGHLATAPASGQLPTGDQKLTDLRHAVLLDPLLPRGQLQIDPQTTMIKGASVVDFRDMMVFNRRDGGSRRPIQRVEVAHEPVWLLVPQRRLVGTSNKAHPSREFQQDAIECDLAARACLEACFVTGTRSALTLDINGVPYAVDLDRMQAVTVPKAHVTAPNSTTDQWATSTSDLVRQPISFHLRCPPSNMYGSEELKQSPSFILDDPSMEAIVLGTREGKSEPDQGPLSAVTAPVAVSDLVGTRCTSTDSMCTSSISLVDCISRFGAGHLLTHRHVCPLGTSNQCFLAVLSQQSRLPEAIRLRCTLHNQYFSHERPPVPPTMTVLEREWRLKYCQLTRVCRQRWDTVSRPVPILPETQTSLQAVHVGMEEGQWVMDNMDNRSIIMMNYFPIIQRIQSTVLLDRYMRGRKEIISDIQTLVPQYSFDMYSHCEEGVGFMVVSRSEMVSIFRGEAEVTTIHSSAAMAMAKVPQAQLFPQRISNKEGEENHAKTKVLMMVAHFKGLPHPGVVTGRPSEAASILQQLTAPLYLSLAAPKDPPETLPSRTTTTAGRSNSRRWDSDDFPLLQPKLIQYHYSALAQQDNEGGPLDPTPPAPSSFVHYNMYSWYPLYTIAFEGYPEAEDKRGGETSTTQN